MPRRKFERITAFTATYFTKYKGTALPVVIGSICTQELQSLSPPQKRMEEFARYKQDLPRKKAELDELWATNTVQESQNASMLRYHGIILLLHEKAQSS